MPSTPESSSLFKGLTSAQKRHLRELHGDGVKTLYWRPANSGEERCAGALRRKGLLSGSFVSYSDAYYLSDEGKRIARLLLGGRGPSFAELAAELELELTEETEAPQ